VTVWDWVDDFTRRAQAEGDRERFRLRQLLDQSSDLRSNSPHAALELYDEGARLAERLGEPWWVMFFAHWRLQTLLYYVRDPSASLELAVRSALEVRKPVYTQMPQRICLQEDLIVAHAQIDPDGYASLIEEALDYMIKEMAPGVECHACLLGLRSGFELSIKRHDRALVYGLELLEYCQTALPPKSRPHHLTITYLGLCGVAHALEDWPAILDWAVAGEEAAASTKLELAIAALLAWKAAALRRRGEEGAARRSYLRAASVAGRISATLGRAYYDPVCAYHELGGELEAAYRTRGRELAGLTGRGCAADECHCHLERCRLVKLMGQPFDQELTAAREAASKLKNPEPFLSDLERAVSDTIPAQ
jgi:hypothetical protein